MELIKSNKGGLKLCFEGHMYIRKKNSLSTIKWVCSKRRSTSCKGSAITDSEVKKFEARGEHSHKPDFEAVEAAKLYCKIKEEIVSGVKPQQILDRNLRDVDLAIRQRIGKGEHVKRRMRYHRRKHELQNQASGDKSQTRENESQATRISQSDLATWAARMMAKRMKLDPTMLKSGREFGISAVSNSNEIAEEVDHSALEDGPATSQSKSLEALCREDTSITDAILKSAKPEDVSENSSPLDKKAKRCLDQMQMLYVMQKRSELCDFTLCLSSSEGNGTVTRTVIEVHKCVLGAASEKIRKSQGNMLKVDQTISPEHINHVLEFAYTGVMPGVLRFEASELLLIAKAAIELGVDKCMSYVINERPDFLHELIAIQTSAKFGLDNDSAEGILQSEEGDSVLEPPPLESFNINTMNAWIERSSSDFDLEDYGSKSDGSDENNGTASENNDNTPNQCSMPPLPLIVKRENTPNEIK